MIRKGAASSRAIRDVKLTKALAARGLRFRRAAAQECGPQRQRGCVEKENNQARRGQRRRFRTIHRAHREAPKVPSYSLPRFAPTSFIINKLCPSTPSSSLYITSRKTSPTSTIASRPSWRPTAKVSKSFSSTMAPAITLSPCCAKSQLSIAA